MIQKNDDPFMRTLKNLYHEAMFPETTKPDYRILRKIMKTELEKHKNEPTYEKFEWQLP